MFVSRQTKENIRLRRFSSSILGSVQQTVFVEYFTPISYPDTTPSISLSGTTLPTTPQTSSSKTPPLNSQVFSCFVYLLELIVIPRSFFAGMSSFFGGVWERKS